MAIIRVEKTRDYTVMSNHHLKNPELTLKAKGLLSLILSLPEKWDFTTRGLASICKEGHECVGSAIRELEKAGYIVRNRIRDEKGRITDTEYVIHEFPQTSTPSPDDGEPPSPAEPDEGKPPVRTENSPESDANDQLAPSPHPAQPGTAYPEPENPDMDFPDADSPAPAFPRPGKSHQLNTKQSKKEKLNTHLSNTDESINPSINHESMHAQVQDIREDVRDRIGYYCLIEAGDRERLDEVVEIITEVMCNASPTMCIGQCVFATVYVQQRLMQLNSLHIEAVLQSLDSMTEQITNIRKYVLACLFNATASLATGTAQQVTHDLYERSKPVELPF